MNHHASPRFWKCYFDLPVDIQKLADDNFELLKNNPRHPSLHFKKVAHLQSVRVGRKYRAIGIEKDQDVVWFWIGTHSEYDSLIK